MYTHPQSAEEYLYYTKCIDGAHYLDPNKHLAWVSFFDPEEFANTSQPVEINWRSQGIVSDVKNQVSLSAYIILTLSYCHDELLSF